MVEDRRTRHTKERIYRAMLLCLDSTSPDKITVKQICDTADINRSTFYAHYPNPITLYKLMEQHLTDGLNRCFINLKDKSITYLEFIRLFLEYCYENADLFLALNKTDSNSLKKACVELLVKYGFLADTIPKKDRPYAFVFYVNGVFSAVDRWLREDRTKSINEMEKLIYRLTYTPDRLKQ